MTSALDVQKKLTEFRAYLASKSPAFNREFSRKRCETSIAFYIVMKLRTFLPQDILDRWMSLAIEHDFTTYQKIFDGQELAMPGELDQLCIEMRLLAEATNKTLKIYRNDKSGMFILHVI